MSEKEKHRILLVDDEPSITKALHRLLRNAGHDIEMCASGEQGLERLKQAPCDYALIITDQRMPGMSGAAFLEQAKEIAPDSIRFLLTGYSDLRAVEEAVNRGEIHRYFTKPWDDDVLIAQVEKALEAVALKRENVRLTSLIRQQNKQLYDLGVTLEKRVRQRTQALDMSNRELKSACRKLERSFLETIQFVLSLIETTDPAMGKYMRHAASLARQLGAYLGLAEHVIDQLEIAGLLHDTGLFGFPEELRHKSEYELAGDQLKMFQQHPVMAAVSFEAVENLTGISEMVLHHHECYDGSGFPSGLGGEDIPLPARILAAVSDYCRVMNYWPKTPREIIAKAASISRVAINLDGLSSVNEMLQKAAETILLHGVNQKYDAIVTAHLVKISRELVASEKRVKPGLTPVEELQPGMVLSQDLILNDGRVLLVASTALNAASIHSLRKVREKNLIPRTIPVAVPGAPNE